MPVTVRFDDGRTWVMPGYAIEAAAAPTTCRSCPTPIVWVTTKRGGKAPIEQDGTSHFANCPAASSWRGNSRNGG